MTMTPRNHRKTDQPLCGKLPVAAALAALGLSQAAPTLAQGDITDEPPATENRYMVLEEVLVTAQKREQTQMSVPMSISTFTAQDMINTGAMDIEGIDDYMPGVEFGNVYSNQSTQLSVQVRGVSSPNISSGQDPSVATFYDNAYMPRATATIPFLDVARVEVLKGPQGTLYGRNATAGVINIIPNRPSDELEGYVRSRLGNHQLVDLEGMINVPINDELAIRANIFDHRRDAVFDNKGKGDDLREEDYTFARAAIQWTPNDSTWIQLAGDWEDRSGNTSYSIGVSEYALSTDPFNDDVENDAVPRDEKRDMYGVSLQIDHDINDQLSVYGIASYRDWDTFNLQDEDGTAAIRRYLDTNNIEDSDIFYSELRFNFVNDDFDIIAGGNYSYEEVYQRTDIGLFADSYMQFISNELLPFAQDAGFLPPDVILDPPNSHIWDYFGDAPDETYLLFSDLATEIQGIPTAVLPPAYAGTYFTETMDNDGEFTNWGIFADVTYNLTDTIRLIGGLRYSYDDKEYSWQTFDNSLPGWPVAPVRVAYSPYDVTDNPDEYFNKFKDDDDWSKTTGRAVTEWDFMDTAMTYLSYATGYKSGGFDGQTFGALLAGPFDQEEMTSYEWGFKGDFFEDSVRVQFAAFYHELDNRQGSEDAKESPDDPTAQPTIVPSDEETLGWELTTNWRPFDSLVLGALTSYRDTDRTQDPFFDSAGEPQGGRKESLDSQLDYTLSLDWTPEIPRGYLLVHVDYVFNEADDDSDDVIYTTGRWYYKDRKMLNSRIAWSNDNDSIEVALWGRNLLDEQIAENPGGFVASDLGAYKTNVQDELTYGVDLRYNF